MNIAVIFAGGVGKRMRSKELPKQFLELHGKPIIVHTIELFNNHPEIDAIVVSCVENWIDFMNLLVEKHSLIKVRSVVPGGKNSQESIYNGLKSARLIANGDDIVLIHDGVRPLITPETIHENIVSVQKYGSAITALEAKETVLLVDENEVISSVPSRAESRLARAPQSFFLDDILEKHEKAIEDGLSSFIDCCTMMQFYGTKLHLVKSPQENIKITTPDDFYMMRALLDAREDAQIYGL